MAPVEPDLHNSNVTVLSLLALQCGSIAACLVVVVSAIGHAARTLPPAHETRNLQARRTRNAFLFSALALTSLALASFFGSSWRLASYRQWAAATAPNTPVPNSLWSGWYGSVENSEETWQLGKWFQDFDFAKELDEPLIKSASGFWWSSQYWIGLTTWSAFVGIEGRRRNFPKKVIIALVALAQQSGLSVAQNLFFVAILFTPMPLAGKDSTEHNPLWTPYPALYLVPTAVAINSFDMMPYVINQPIGAWIVRSSYFAAPMILSIVAQIAPSNWGRVHGSARVAHRSAASVFHWLAVMSFFFYAKRTLTSVLLATPQKETGVFNYYIWGTQPEAQISAVDKARVAFWRLLNVISHQPVISAYGWDVLFSASSLCIWALVRNLDVVDMLRCSAVPFVSLPEEEVERASSVESEDSHRHLKHVSFPPDTHLTNSISASLSSSSSPQPTQTPRRSTRNRHRKTETSYATPATPRRSTRSRKTEPVDENHDAWIAPARTRREVAQLENDDESVATTEDVVEDAEAFTLAWGLCIIGGLGVAGAGVLGAEASGR